MRKNLILAALACGAFLALAPAARAHFLWLDPPAAPAQPGQPAGVTIGWGHGFPNSEDCDAAKIDKVRAMGPEGGTAGLARRGELAYTLTPREPGCHLVLASYRPGFLTKTTQGYKHQDKQGLPEALHCFRYDLRAKALVPAGRGGGCDRRAGDTLEIVPRSDPSQLRPGDTLPVLVLYQGRPLAGAGVRATHAGFSEQPNRFAWQGATDARGVALVPLTRSGLQMIAVTHQLPYPQPERCDQIMYKYALTFHLP
jgi:uncharacterized GH25 family protein